MHFFYILIPHWLITLVRVQSLICMVLTITVYLYVNKLRNEPGKCLVFFVFCRFVGDLIFLLNGWKLFKLFGICSAAGYTCYFFVMAENLWCTVFSHCVRKGLKSVNRNDLRSSFLAYNIFAWCTAASLTAVIYLLDYYFDSHQYSTLLPGVGLNECWLNVMGRAYTIYIQLPISVLNTYSVIVFILTAFNIAKVKRDLRRFHNNERTIKLKSDKKNFLMLLRLFTIMALSWSLFIIYRLTEGDIQMAVIVVQCYFHLSLGIIIFAMFILKRSTLRLFMKSIQRRQDANNVQTA